MSNSQDSIQFRSEVAGLLLGTYDLERFGAVLSAHDDPQLVPVTLSHENYHQRLNNASTYGHMLTTIAQRIKQKYHNSSTQKAQSTMHDLNYLVAQSVVVHEMVATHNSLVVHDRTDLVASLPRDYREWFNSMKMMGMGLPQTRLWQTTACWHLARIAMLVKPFNLGGLFSPNTRRIVKEVSKSPLLSPNARLRIMQPIMQGINFERFRCYFQKWDFSDYFLAGLRDERSVNEMLSAFSDSDEPSAVAGCLEMPVDAWPVLVRHFDYLVERGLFMVFEKISPGLDEAEDDRRFGQLNREVQEQMSLPSSVHLRARSDELFVRREIVNACNQRIMAFEPGLISTVIPNVKDQMPTSFGLESFRKLGATYTLQLFRADVRTGVVERTEEHVIDFPVGGRVPHLVTHGPGEAAGFAMVPPVVAILEVDAPAEMWVRDLVIATAMAHIPPNLVVGRLRHMPVAARGEDLQVEHPV